MLIKNIKRARSLLVFIILPFGFFLLVHLGAEVNWGFGLLGMLYGVSILFLASRIICPRCHKPVGWNKYKTLAVRSEAWSVFTPKRCLYCGYDLSGREGNVKE